MLPCPGDLSLGELIEGCRRESESYLAGRLHDEAYCFELFRRAIFDHDQRAWQALYTQYHALLVAWTWRHRQFRHTGEEAAFYVNAAFVSFWRTVSKPQATLRFNGLSQLLRYLKRCLHSAIEDEYRRQRRQPLDTLGWEELSETLVDDVPSLEERIISQAETDNLQQAILKRLRSEAEEVVATLSWLYGLPPQEIQTHRPDLFADVRRVYRVKRNILNRLRRDPERWEF